MVQLRVCSNILEEQSPNLSGVTQDKHFNGFFNAFSYLFYGVIITKFVHHYDEYQFLLIITTSIYGFDEKTSTFKLF